MAQKNSTNKASVSNSQPATENNWLKPNAYYAVALLLLLTAAFIYFFPSLSGKTLGAHDFQQGVASTKELVDYHKQTGEYAGWTGNMFSGMPAYQVWRSYNNVASWILDTLYNIPGVYIYICILFIVSAFVLFYAMQWHPLLVILGGLGLMFSNFSMVSLMAGHNNKVMVIALVPMTLGGIWLLYERKKYLIGLFIIALSIAFQLRSNHFQITYFMFFLVGMWTVINLIYWVKEKAIKHAIISIFLLVIGISIGALSNTVQLWTTQEYSAETQRGGPSPMDIAMQEQNKTTQQPGSTGVDYDYATKWCYGKLETFTLLIPGFSGGASQTDVGDKSNTYKILVDNGVPADQAKPFVSQLPTYWGSQPFTAGTTYMGAVLLALMVIGLVFVKGKTRWILASTLMITLFIAWGKNFDFFYRLLFEYLPFFNKFRTPNMIFYLSTIIVVMLGGMGLQALIKEENKSLIWKKYIKTARAIAGFMLFMSIIAPSILSFRSEAPQDSNPDVMLQSNLLQATGNNQDFVNKIYDALLKDRKSMMQKDAIISTIFIVLALGLIALYLKKQIGAQTMLAGLCALVMIDLGRVDWEYVNYQSFVTKEDAKISGVPLRKADEFILQDKDPSYRVLDLATNTFNDASTSYYHKSIGGYHSAKLKRYQDVISYAFSESVDKIRQGKPEEANILNMLNTRYIITSEEAAGVFKNPGAFGNAWFTDTIKVLETPVEVFKALSTENLKNVALMDVTDGQDKGITHLEPDSIATIRLDSYSPDKMVYTYRASHKRFAVFSEIYYNSGKGWVAYVDGNKVEHFRVNYILRGMLLPSGEHKVEFRFEPGSLEKGGKMDLAGSGLIIIIGLGVLAQYFMDRKKKNQLN